MAGRMTVLLVGVCAVVISGILLLGLGVRDATPARIVVGWTAGTEGGNGQATAEPPAIVERTSPANASPGRLPGCSDPVLAEFVNKNSKSPRVTANQTARLPAIRNPADIPAVVAVLLDTSVSGHSK